MKKGQRRALRRNQVADLILHGSLTTTEAKAKVLKSEAELLISRAKKTDLATRRRVLASLPKKQAAKKLFDQIIPQFKGRVGGYVRVVKLPPRKGDNAPIARVEFVEEIKEKVAEEPKIAKKVGAKKATTAREPKGKVKSRKKEDAKKNKSNKSKRS